MQDRETVAVAIFVKTPGLSPIKTRLASSIGQAAAERFHLLSSQAVESVVRQVANAEGLTSYWAVAEEDAMELPLWQSFRVIWQGDGSLGERLSRVYDELIQRHSSVIFLGADSPLLTSRLLEMGSQNLAQGKGSTFVLGRAEDGGFYLFGGSVPIGREIWLSIPYSAPNTAHELAKRLKEFGRVEELPVLRDVDTAADLNALLQDGASRTDLTGDQWTLLKWVEGQVGGKYEKT